MTLESNAGAAAEAVAAEILVLGDSHAEVFRMPVVVEAMRPRSARVVTVAGATVSGLQNPNSVSNALPIFNETLSESSADTVVCMLGEVDTGFVIWYRAEKYGYPTHWMLEMAVRSYKTFMEGIARTRRVVCISAPLPTIPDGHTWGEVANARKEVMASQRNRTDMTLQFNGRVSESCRAIGAEFVSLDGVSIGEDGLVSADLLNADPNDHHYDHSRYAALIVRYAVPMIHG